MSDHDGPLENEASNRQETQINSLDVRNGYIADGITVSLEVSESMTLIGLLSLLVKSIPIISGFFKLSLRVLRTLAYIFRWKINSGRHNEDPETEIATQSRLKNDFGWLVLNTFIITLITVGLLLGGPLAFLIGSGLNDVLEIYGDITCSIDDSSTGIGYIWDVYRDYLRDRSQRDLLLRENEYFPWFDQRTKINLASNCSLAIGKVGCAIITIISIALGSFPPALVITAIALSALVLISRFVAFVYNKSSRKPALLKKQKTNTLSTIQEETAPFLSHSFLPQSPVPVRKSSTQCNKPTHTPTTPISSKKIIDLPIQMPEKKGLRWRSHSCPDKPATACPLISSLPRSQSYPNIHTLFNKKSPNQSSDASKYAKDDLSIVIRDETKALRRLSHALVR